MDAYVYRAALWCSDCASEVMGRLAAAGKAPASPDDEHTYDSDDYPKGPCPNGGGEADFPQHCAGCEVFLKNPLTSDGCAYVEEALSHGAAEGVLLAWADFYWLRPGVAS
jgi:hypothetical protein